MKKNELLEFLLENITYFKNVSEEDFYLLSNSDSSQLGLIKNDNYQITKLLKQISEYALIKEVLTNEQIMDIRNSLLFEDGFILYDCLDIIDKCNQYMDILYNEDCHHPSVTNYMNLNIGAALYEMILETICELIKYTNDKFQDDLIDLSNIIDDKVVEIPDFIFKHIIEMLDNNSIHSSYELLSYLNNYSRNFLITKFGFPIVSIQNNEKNNIYYINDWIFNIKKDSKLHPKFNLKVSHFLECCSLILEKANKYKEYSDDIQVITLINDLEELYYLYESYKYRFIRDDYKEQKLLEKCKKM